MTDSDPELLATLVPAVEQQMSSAETAFVKEAFERVVTESEIEAEEVKLMLAVCLADEMERMLAEEREFDLERYRTLLELLPALPE